MQPCFAATEPFDHPFSYYSPSQEEKANTIYVPENFYAVLNDDSQRALAGYLKPCIMIALHNTETNKTLVFNKHYSNSMASLVKIVEKEFDRFNPDLLKGVLYSSYTDDYEEIQEFYDKKRGLWTANGSWKEVHQGRSQEEELAYIKNQLHEKLDMQIDAMSHYLAPEITEDYSLGLDDDKFDFMYVNRSLDCFNISITAENIFRANDPSLGNLENNWETAMLVNQLSTWCNKNLVPAAAQQIQDFEPAYGTVPFFEIQKKLLYVISLDFI